MLVVLGILGGLYFWLTDPRFGPRALHVLRGSPDNVVDAANTAWPVTLVGIAGSLAVLGIGCWLVGRRTV